MGEALKYGLDRDSVEAVLNLLDLDVVASMPWAVSQAALDKFAEPVFTHEDQYIPDKSPRVVVQHRNARLSG